MPNSLESTEYDPDRMRQLVVPRWQSRRKNPRILGIIDTPVLSNGNRGPLIDELLNLRNGATYFDSIETQASTGDARSIPDALLHLWEIADTHGIGANQAKAHTGRLPKSLFLPEDPDGITIINLNSRMIYGVEQGPNFATGFVDPNSALTFMPYTRASIATLGGFVMLSNSAPPQDNVSRFEFGHALPPSAAEVRRSLTA